MKYRNNFRETAIKLRYQGKSYNEIRQRIPVAKSTLSLWLKDVPLKAAHRKRLYTKQIAILSRGAHSQRERRIQEITQIIQKAKSEITRPISPETLRLFGAGLYWSEGSKTRDFEITNSDPYFIAFMVQWFGFVFGVPATLLTARLNIYPQQDEVKIKKFWSNITGIPLRNFRKSYIKPLNKGYKKNNLYYGTIKVRVPKGTNMRHRVFGWVQAVLQDISGQIKLSERRWISLRNTPRPVNII